MSEPLLQFEDVTFSYGDDPPALSGIDLQIRSGEAIGLIGQNGSGKTTLAKHMNGLLHPDSGRVTLNGRDTRNATTGELAATAGYVFQNPDHQIFSPSVEQEIAFGPRNLGLDGEHLKERIDSAIERFGLDGVRDRHPTLLGRGLRRRVAIASVFALQPKLMILDEPTGGLDRRHALELLGLLRTLLDDGCAVILISHDMRLVAEFAERVVIMRGGSIVADGDTRDLFPSEQLMMSAGLAAPEITRLSCQLRVEGIGPSVRLSEFIDQFRFVYGRALRDERLISEP